MRTTGFGALALAAVAGLVACATVDISTDYDKKADFSRFSTFKVLPSKEVNDKNYLAAERIEDAITKVLATKGLKPAADNPDLWVAYHARVDRQTQLDTTSFGYGWGGWAGYYGPYGAWGPYGMSASTTTVREVPVGMLIVDVVEAGSKQLVWQGTATGTLDPRATADDKDWRVNNAVKRMFVDFPPKAK